MNGVEADDRWDPDVQGPPPTGWPTAPRPAPARRETVYSRGAERCRAILREHGAPDHGPAYQPRPPKKEGA